MHPQLLDRDIELLAIQPCPRLQRLLRLRSRREPIENLRQNRSVGIIALEEKVMREAILVTKHQNRPRRRSIPSRAPDLLIVAFDTAGQSRVNYGANVRLVHAHPERNRRHDHLELPIQEIGLHRLPRLPVEPRMIRRRGKVLLQLKRERLRVSPPGRVNDGRAPSLSLEQLARELK